MTCLLDNLEKFKLTLAIAAPSANRAKVPVVKVQVLKRKMKVSVSKHIY